MNIHLLWCTYLHLMLLLYMIVWRCNGRQIYFAWIHCTRFCDRRKFQALEFAVTFYINNILRIGNVQCTDGTGRVASRNASGLHPLQDPPYHGTRKAASPLSAVASAENLPTTWIRTAAMRFQPPRVIVSHVAVLSALVLPALFCSGRYDDPSRSFLQQTAVVDLVS